MTKSKIPQISIIGLILVILLMAEALPARTSQECELASPNSSSNETSLTDDELRQLAFDINHLYGHYQVKIVQIIKEKEPLHGGPDPDEFAINFEELQTSTLRELEKYVKEILGDNREKISDLQLEDEQHFAGN